MTAKKIIELLISKGLIPKEHKVLAITELDRELRRRSSRLASKLAQAASREVYERHKHDI